MYGRQGWGSARRDDHRFIFKEVLQHDPRGDDAMAPNNMDALEWLRKHLDAEGDAEAVMAQTLAQVSYNQQPKTIW
jgi:hypothetical protein